MPKPLRSRSLRVLECPQGTEYSEEAFLYFLALEQARADRSNHALPVLLATLEPVPGEPIAFPQAGASTLFKGLRSSLRDTDVMGWYRQGRVAGAVLTAPGSHDPAVVGPLAERVGEGLRRQLPAHLASSLRLRVVHQGVRRLDAMNRGVK